MKKALLNAAVIGVGVLVLWQTTNGFTTFTSEQLRRAEVRAKPMALPDIPLKNQDGQTLRIRDYKGHLLLVDFIFTHCAGLCPHMTSSMQRLYRRTENAKPQEQVFLLTISFDPSRDTPKRLKEYGTQFGADFQRWKFASAQHDDLQKLLDAVGIVVIPQSNNQFQHNAAVHIIDRHGRLADIQNYESLEAMMASIHRLSAEQERLSAPLPPSRLAMAGSHQRAADFAHHQTCSMELAMVGSHQQAADFAHHQTCGMKLAMVAIHQQAAEQADTLVPLAAYPRHIKRTIVADPVGTPEIGAGYNAQTGRPVMADPVDRLKLLTTPRWYGWLLSKNLSGICQPHHC